MGGHGFSPRSVLRRRYSVLRCCSTRGLRRPAVKKGEEAMEILEAYDLTGTLRGAAALAGCDHKTVARLVAAREEVVAGCRCELVRGRWWTRSLRRSMSWSIAPARRSWLTSRTRFWCRWAMKGHIA